MNIYLSDENLQILEELAPRWGLSTSATVAHALQRAAEAEKIPTARPG